jgi:hypothetical protein
MSQRFYDSDRELNRADEARLRLRGEPVEMSAASRFEFDSSAWTALVEEQRLLIAHAAGVDPSKVRIHVGH